jgi:3-hydroxyisobutyrate dehydrogenase-like beta-hydroxyacid dehydrogenase
MARQGVYAAGCQIQRFRCTKPTAAATAAAAAEAEATAEAAALCATADDLIRMVTRAANKQLSSGSGSNSSSEWLYCVQFVQMYNVLLT